MDELIQEFPRGEKIVAGGTKMDMLVKRIVDMRGCMEIMDMELRMKWEI